MSAQSEQARARQAYAGGREQRDSGNVQRAQDNARINGGATAGSQSGGAR
ncbi:hypothetical protein [Streptomyces griseofuscus]|uniref:Uncharacterized protein n=1 Tax=Streptomyces griseofuscus TaxID=146922 RepID=A0A7H1Q3J5_9ACTN|nr:hypothetical protein [Streptomyces griseofuscus]QNT94875.1 hypothetical protein HEP81_04602 [Streptomyces griseofuscus]